VLDFLLGAGGWRELLKRRNIVDRMRSSGLSYTRELTSQATALENSSAELIATTRRLTRARQEFEHFKEVYGKTERALRQEQAELRSGQRKLQRQLDLVRNNRRMLQLQREQSKRALDAIKDMIESIASGKPISGTPLNLLKGKLPWPATGSLVSKFGQSRNERLATVTDNPGIEIACAAETPVRAVAPGKVSSVTWLRGFGNVCIVEHPGSYFTVYARLGQVSVAADDVVNESTLLGYPSLDPLNNTHQLHFEIWDRREKQDPLRWLRRQ
jgi:septal ring factor EnvC (AmiA/AmiB activator)